MRFTNVKYCILHLGHSNSMQHHGLRKDWLKICPVEKDLGILVQVLDTHWLAEHEPVCVQMAKKPKGILACRKTRVDSRTRAVIL